MSTTSSCVAANDVTPDKSVRAGGGHVAVVIGSPTISGSWVKPRATPPPHGMIATAAAQAASKAIARRLPAGLDL